MITFGFTYVWNGKRLQIEKFRGTNEEDRKGTYVRAGNYYYDQNLVSTEAADFIQNAVA
jgi:hypothetical protein